MLTAVCLRQHQATDLVAKAAADGPATPEHVPNGVGAAGTEIYRPIKILLLGLHPCGAAAEAALVDLKGRLREVRAPLAEVLGL